MRETLRAQAKARAGVGVKLRFDEAFRAQAVEYVRGRQAQGVTQEAAAKELGMSSWTLSRWHQQMRRGGVSAKGGKETSRAFRPVAVKRGPTLAPPDKPRPIGPVPGASTLRTHRTRPARRTSGACRPSWS
ncbi:transposase [Myxococcus faecalis]|uniref:transposase n=1 Tax=Myxococcus faecalis TaxID=3115646 RepID=UPI003CF776DA